MKTKCSEKTRPGDQAQIEPAVCKLAAVPNGAAGIRVEQYLIFFLVCIVSLTFFHAPGTSDVNIWGAWINNARQMGIVNGYAANGRDYPPLSTVILFMVFKASDFLHINAFSGFKLSLFIFLVFSSLLFAVWSKDVTLASVLLLSLVMNSMALGYLDIYFAPALIIAFWALEKEKLTLAMVFFILSCMIKWQPLILAPFIALYGLKRENIKDLKGADLKRLFLSAGLPCLGAVFLFPWIFGSEIFRAFNRATSHAYLSGNALNFNWILTHFLHVFSPERFGPLKNGLAEYIMTKDVSITLLPRFLFFAFYAATLLMFFKQKKTFANLVLFSLSGYLAYCIFNTGVHENHFFLACILVIMLYWTDRSHLRTLLAVVVCANLNLFIFYGIRGDGLPFNRVIGVDLALIISIVNVIFFFMVFSSAVKIFRDRRWEISRCPSV
ncbi:MAG: hypothetical protein AB1611_14845 [bacterium]